MRGVGHEKIASAVARAAPGAKGQGFPADAWAGLKDVFG
jgi:hypothetical protein